MQNLKELTKEIPYQWRVQSFSKNKPSCSCVAYIDARDVMKILDEVVGVENWQDDYRVVKDQMFAGIGIRVNDSWVWKWDTGTESQTEGEKGIVSDSFKRAAVKWGVGRFLYDLEIKHIPANEAKTNSNYPYPVDEQGKRIWDLTKHINGNKPVPKTKPAEVVEDSDKQILRDLVRTSTLDAAQRISTLEKIENCPNYKQYGIYKAKLESVQQGFDEIPNPNQSDINKQVKKISGHPDGLPAPKRNGVGEVIK